MNWKLIKYAISPIVLFALLSGCVQSDHTRLVNEELAKGIRKDSVLLGIRFGDTRTEFRAKCFELNRKHLTTEGAGYDVKYILYDSLLHKTPANIQLLFVPGFDENEILTAMDLKFSYLGWAPWNRRFQSDSLKNKVIKLLMHWYGGNKFVTVNLDNSEVPAKVDGNRRILVYEDPPQNVIVKIQDMVHAKE